jgi:hypothetical protein
LSDTDIHDWIGAVFIPRATFESVLAVVHDYDRYKDFYKPVVVDSKLLVCTGVDQDFSMTWRRRVLFVNAAMEGQYRPHDFAVDARRGYGVADTRQVQEIDGYGDSGEHLLPPDQGNGNIWRLHPGDGEDEVVSSVGPTVSLRELLRGQYP